MTMIQVTVEYKLDGGACVPIRLHTVVISAQHTKGTSQEVIIRPALKKLIKVMIIYYRHDVIGHNVELLISLGSDTS